MLSCWTCKSPLPEKIFFWQGEPEKFCSEGCAEKIPPDWAKIKPDNVPTEIPHGAIREILRAWNLPISPKFLAPDGLVVVALLCNAAAKSQEWGGFSVSEGWDWFYDLKPGLIAAAAWRHNSVWYEDGIIYFETCVGQISFHVFEEESDTWELLPTANGRKWTGGGMQDNAHALALAFLAGGEDPFLEMQCRAFLAFD